MISELVTTLEVARPIGIINALDETPEIRTPMNRKHNIYSMTYNASL